MKKIKSLVLAVIGLLCSLSVSAHEFEVDGIYYNIKWSTDMTAEVTYCGNNSATYLNEYSATVTIPESVTCYGNTFSVTSIGDGAFAYCSGLTSVVIPNSVTSIGSSAFLGCSGLTSMVIPNSVTSIGSSAFYNCDGLTSVVIPNSVTSIGYSAFAGCSGLTSVVIPNSVTSIGLSAFYDCSGLTSVVIPNSVTSIGDNAFYNCEGLKVVLNNSSLTFTKGSSSYGYIAYYAKDVYNGYEQVDDFIFAEANDACYIGLYIGNATELVLPANYKGRNYHIGLSAFYGCSGLTSVVIPNSVTSIGDYAFRNCNNLKVVLNNSSLTFTKGSSNYGYIARYAEEVYNGYEQVDDFIFAEANDACYIGLYIGNATELVLPANYKGRNYHIGQYAFKGCSGLTSLTIGAGVLSIGSNQCSPTKTIWLTNTPPSGWKNLEGTINYVANEQYGSSSNVKVYPYLSSMFETDGIKYVPVSPSERTCDAIDCNYDSAVEEINLGETVSYRGVAMTVKNVMPYVAYGQKTVKKLSVSNKGDVGASAFYMCSALTNATISNEGNIGASAFEGAMTSTNTELEVTNKGSIDEKAFYGCTAITNATISNEGNIGTSAFEGAMKSANATINITNKGNIGDKAFYGCSAITNATISNEGNIGASAFEGAMTSANATINITNKGNIGDKAFYRCTAIANATISNEGNIGASAFAYAMTSENATINITNKGNIGDKAFYGCSAITNAMIFNEGWINSEAFRGCTSLTSLTLGDSIQSIGASAFRKCSSLMEAKMPKLVTRIGDYCFASTTALKHVELCDSLQGIGISCFSGSGLESISIPASVTSIGNYAFDDCTKLIDVVIEDRTADLSLGSNGSSPLFADCPLDSVYIGGNITYNTSSSYGYSPFYRNTSLRSVVITDKEEEISDNEFYGCTNLKNVTIGSDVKKIGNWAFSGCSNLDYFSFGKSVESIGQEAFSDCVNLTKLISYAEVPPTCGTMALDDINKWNCVLQVPGDCISAYQQADQWKEFFFIEDVLTSIGGVTADGAVSATADVYSTNGMLVKRNADLKSLKHELPAGIYIIGGKKVWVK